MQLESITWRYYVENDRRVHEVLKQMRNFSHLKRKEKGGREGPPCLQSWLRIKGLFRVKVKGTARQLPGTQVAVAGIVGGHPVLLYVLYVEVEARHISYNITYLI